MRTPIPDYLDEVLTAVRDEDDGKVADYIPELADADPSKLAIAFSTLDGQVYAAGDASTSFTIQSISKPFAYALAIRECGVDAVLERIGVEPSGEAFNEISLEEGSKRPRNPMINAGAITCHSLLGSTEDERFGVVLGWLSALAGRELTVDESVFESELETAHRNLSIAHMLRSYEILTCDPAEIVSGYTRQCAIEVTVEDLALMVTTLANGGVQPKTGKRVLGGNTVRQVLSVMTTCGMYDAAGDWVTSVGIPAKSGVSGGIVGALPGQVGIATYSPRLDEHGNSVRGVELFERLSRDMGMHMLEVPDAARSVISVIRTVETDGGPYRLFALQGSIQFASGERIARALADDETTDCPVVIDIDEVFEINNVGRRMLHEVVRRLSDDGREVTIVDPDGLLSDAKPEDELPARIVTKRPPASHA